MKKNTITQRDYISASLKMGQTITPIQALYSFGCFRLAARIAEIRAMGHEITTERLPNGVARYSLSK